MKKWVAMLLAVSLMTTMAACGSKKETTLDTNKTYTVACSADFPPYEYFDNEKIVGAEVEVMDAIAAKLGIQVRYEDMDFDSIIPAIQSKKYDIGMSGFTITEDRKLVVNFTDSYTTSCQAILVPEGSPITTVDDLSNNIGAYKIGVQLATTGDLYASDTPENGGFGSDNVEEYTKSTDAVLALTTGKIDCVIIDEAVAKAFAAANPGLKVLDTAYVVEDYAMVLNKDDEVLLAKMNEAVQALLADGTIQGIMDKYISE